MGEQLKASERHADAVATLNSGLGSVTSQLELRTAIQKLMASNAAYQRETSELEQAQAEARQLRQKAKIAEKLASIDPLTNIANRRNSTKNCKSRSRCPTRRRCRSAS